MTTIILTIIGILLAASAALMVTFYGGGVFSSGVSAAGASTVQTGGSAVLAAVELFKSEKAYAPASLADLKTNGVGGPFLKGDPVIPAGASQQYAGSQYIVSNLDILVCDRINYNLNLSGVTSATSPFAQKMICIPQTSTTGTFYANS